VVCTLVFEAGGEGLLLLRNHRSWSSLARRQYKDTIINSVETTTT